MHVTLDSLGESVSSDVEAHRAAEIYHQLLDLIANEKLDANISVKLTQMGLSFRRRWPRRLPKASQNTPPRWEILCASTWKIRH